MEGSGRPRRPVRRSAGSARPGRATRYWARPSAAVVVRPVRRAARGNGVVEYLVLVGGPGRAVLAGCAAVPFPGAEQELIGPAPVARSPGIAAALFGIADADAERRVSSVATRLRRR